MRLTILLFILIPIAPLMAADTALSGTVLSPAGMPVEGARITAGHASAESDTAGAWKLDVPVGTYVITISASGYRERELKDVAAPSPPIAISLETLEKSADDQSQAVVYQPVVDVERTNEADFISDRQLQNLPVNQRNYVSLATLTPGVSPVNDYVGVTDAPLVQAPESGLSFGGNNGRGNVFWLDGGEDYINTGGVRPSISQEAVAEFQVVRSNYSAEWGGGIGGIVNIISKSGSNTLHGDIFGFLRDSASDARNYFSPAKGSYTRSQTGATLGGPLVKSRTYFFLSYERLARNQTAYVSVGGNQSFSSLTPSQQALVSYLATTQVQPLTNLGQALQQLLTTSNYPGTVALFKSNTGFFPFHELDDQGAFRIDHNFTDNHHAFLRFNASRGDSDNADVDSLTSFSRSTVTGISDATLMLNDTYVLSERLVSESRLQLVRTKYNAGNQDQLGPTIDIDGYGLFGKDWTLPSNATEWHGQFQQNFFFTPNRHSIRFGIDINPVHATAKVNTSIGGQFSFGEYLTLGELLNAQSGASGSASLLSGFLQAAGQNSLAGALNDPLTALQVYNLGLPSVYIQGFGNPVWAGIFQRYNFFFNDVYQATARLTLNMGVRYELEKPPAPLKTDPTNVGPRLGLAWDATGDKKTVIRAGFGLFYLRQQNQIAAALGIENGTTYNQIEVPLSGLPGSINPATGMPVTSADIFQGLSQEGIIGKRAIQASDLAQFGIVPGPNFPYQITFVRPVDFRNAYSEQASFEIERAFGSFSVLASYNYNRGLHLPRLLDLNETYGPPGPLGLLTIVPLNPLVSQLLTYQSAADSFYNASFLQVSRRFSRTLTLDAHYTFGKSIDETTDINFLPNNSLNPRSDRGLSTFDQRHRLVISAVQQIPGGTGGLWSRIFGGWTLSPIVTANSGRPFNVVTGVDFNSLRPAGAGRNIGHGPAFASVDGRLSRTTHLSERVQLEWIAEGFNLLNHTNFLRLNNTVGQITVDQLPHPLVGDKGDPSDPLSFVSAFDPREIQFALKVRF